MMKSLTTFCDCGDDESGSRILSQRQQKKKIISIMCTTTAFWAFPSLIFPPEWHTIYQPSPCSFHLCSPSHPHPSNSHRHDASHHQSQSFCPSDGRETAGLNSKGINKVSALTWPRIIFDPSDVCGQPVSRPRITMKHPVIHFQVQVPMLYTVQQHHRRGPQFAANSSPAPPLRYCSAAEIMPVAHEQLRRC